MMMKAFNGDFYIKKEIQKIINDFGINTVIETGTYKGETTFGLSRMMKDKKVATVEKNLTYFNEAEKYLSKCKNVVMYLGSSPNVLNSMLNFMIRPIFFYLDAHWGKYNPLIDELRTIQKFKLFDSCIAIHDFKVPDSKMLGYDKFPDGREYEFDQIKNNVEKIYKKRFNYYYNNDFESAGSMRGIIYITPKGH